MPLRLDFLPPATRRLFERLSGEALLAGFVLVGGSALALQIGHRLSEDLDFALFGPQLPSARLDALLAALEAEGREVSLMTPQSQIERFRINSGRKLLDYARDYAVDGAESTFFAHGANAPRAHMDFLAKSAEAPPDMRFAVLGLNGLFAMKALLLAERSRSRDVFDLMALIRGHGFRIGDAFHLIETLAPVERRDVERHKAVLTGAIALDPEDEGFERLGLDTDVASLYAFFEAEIARYERGLAREILLAERPAGKES